MRNGTFNALEAALLQAQCFDAPTHPAFIEQLLLRLVDGEGNRSFWDLPVTLRSQLILCMVKRESFILRWKDIILATQPEYFSRLDLGEGLDARTAAQYTCLQLLQVPPVFGWVSSTGAGSTNTDRPDHRTGSADQTRLLSEVHHCLEQYQALTTALQDALRRLSELLDMDEESRTSLDAVSQVPGRSAASSSCPEDAMPNLSGSSSFTLRSKGPRTSLPCTPVTGNSVDSTPCGPAVARWSSIPPPSFYSAGAPGESSFPLPSYPCPPSCIEQGAARDSPPDLGRDSVSPGDSSGDDGDNGSEFLPSGNSSDGSTLMDSGEEEMGE